MVITGRVPLLLLLGVAAVVLRPQAITAWLWLLAVLLLAALDWFLAPRPLAFQVSRHRLAPVRLHQATTTRLDVSTTASRPVRALLRDAWPPSADATGNRHRLRLEPGERVSLETSLRPTRRGDLRAAGVTVRCFGPLGLAARQATLDVPGALRSLPPFESRKHLPSRLARLRELDGRTAVRLRAPGTEFDSLREYVRGDDVRSIDWRATARTRNVVVRTWQPERDRRVVLLLDTSRTSAGRIDDVPRLDSAMDAGLLLAALAARAGDRVDFVAGDREIRAKVRTSGQREVTARLQDSMADLQPVLAEADWHSLAAAVHGLGRQRALLVLLTSLEPSAIEEGLLPALPSLTRHHRVVVASVSDPALIAMTEQRSSVDEVYAAAAAAQVQQQRRRTAELLGALGVHVIDVDAPSLPPALADHYLALKSEGLL